MSRICRCGCGKAATLVCSGCKSAVYFDSGCQERDWPVHRQICFMDDVLDPITKESGAIGARIGKVRKGAKIVPKRYIDALPATAKQILGNHRFVPVRIYFMTPTAFDKKAGWSAMTHPYPGVMAFRGSVYIRGEPESPEFNRCMAFLARIGEEPGAAAVLKKEATKFYSTAVDTAPSPLEVIAMIRDPKLSTEEQIIILGAMAEYITEMGSETVLALPCELLRAAYLSSKIDTLVAQMAEEQSGQMGKKVEPVRHPSVESMLNKVWSRTDVGFMAMGTRSDDPMTRILSIPPDLLRRCSACTVAGRVGTCVAVLDAMPNLKILRVANVYGDLDPLIAAAKRLRHLEEVECSPSAVADDAKYAGFADPELRVKKLKIPFSNRPMRFPDTLANLSLNQYSGGERRMLGLAEGIPVPSVVKLKIHRHADSRDEKPMDVAAAITRSFPNVSKFDLTASFGESADLVREIFAGFRKPLSHIAVSLEDSGIVELCRFLASHMNSELSELRILSTHGETRDISDVLNNCPNLRKLSLSHRLVKSLRGLRPHLDALDVAGLPPDYPSGLLGSKVIHVDEMPGNVLVTKFAPEDRPRAILFGRIGGELVLPSYAGYMHDVAALKISNVLNLDAIEYFGNLFSSAPGIRFLSIDITSLGNPHTVGEYSGPRGSLSTLEISSINESQLWWLFDKVLRNIESPENLVLHVFSGINDVPLDADRIRWILARVPNTRTLLVGSTTGKYRNTEFYPVDVLVREYAPYIYDMKFKELTWFERPWNKGFDSI